jgi:hypothetical protein
LLSRRALEALLQLGESHRFLRGMVSWLGFRVASVAFQAAPRAAGRSQYTLGRMARLATDGMLSFSYVPVRLPLFAGLGVGLLGAAHALVMAALAVAGAAQPWLVHLVLLAVLVLGGCILTSLGVLGEYLARVYEQVKQRPIYLLKESSPPAGYRTVLETGQARPAGRGCAV